MAVHRRFDDRPPQSDDRAGEPTPRDRRSFDPRWRRAYEDPWATVRREVDRSRRHAHQLVLMRLAMPYRGRHERQALMATARALSGVLRGVDSVWVDHDGILVLLPESDRAAAEALLGRLPASAPAVATARVSLACFPEDGLTTNALRAAIGRTEPLPRSLPADRTGLLAAQPRSKKAAR